MHKDDLNRDRVTYVVNPGIIWWHRDLKALYFGQVLWIELLYGRLIVTWRKRRIVGR